MVFGTRRKRPVTDPPRQRPKVARRTPLAQCVGGKACIHKLIREEMDDRPLSAVSIVQRQNAEVLNNLPGLWFSGGTWNVPQGLPVALFVSFVSVDAKPSSAARTTSSSGCW